MTSRYKYLKTSIRHFVSLIQPIKKMEQVRNQVFETFGSGIIEGDRFEKNLNKLISLMSNVTADDVRLDREFLKPRGRYDAPVTYIEILEHPRFTINMFILRPGSRLPLHDHPNMYGICKVVHGKVRIRNFTLEAQEVKNKKGNVVTALVEPERFAHESDGAILLTPKRCNVHEITTVGSCGAAFLDVLAPPYLSNIDGLGPRPCHYFLESRDSRPGEYVELLKVDRTADYYTDIAPYLGE